ncbi:UNVERIFIED_CONTAM: Glutamate receptor 2.7 [Sesamum calycinum]|uniref:Glutamate receptor n=1 Tax=Sesamum calycinum TaxID=2727403 RepID=A0AAW2RUR9_9LAMI
MPHVTSPSASNYICSKLCAVLELLEKEEVHGIIGPPGYSTEETFFTELGQRVHVPIISFTARTSALSSAGNHYFIRTRPNDAVQAQALAVMCRGFEWSEVVVLYEDTEFGNQFLSHINKALEEVEIGLAYMVAFPSSAEDSYLLKQLNKLSTKQTRVFIVHMNPSLGFRLFTLAENAGVLREGFAWIVTDSISNFMNSVDSITRDSMQGVLGVRPHVPSSKELKSFQQRWKRSMILENTTSPITELNVHGLWAYDVVTALAIAIENIKPVNPLLFGVNKRRDGTEKRKMRISTFGPKLLSELSSTKFRGLTGDFQLVDGELKLSAFEIFNVVGTGEKIVGYWTSDRGIKRELSESRSTEQLKSIVWPGDSVIRPKGWAIPTAGNLRVGIPSTRGYREFVNVTIDPTTEHTNATGFSIDIFLAALDVIPFPVNYEFHHYNDTQSIDWTYDDMLHEIPQRFDMVVGDTTIWAPRVAYVDFALPYSESGVVLVVKNKKPIDMWIFVKPLRWDLWLTIIMICIYLGIVIHILERRVTSNGTDSLNSKKERPRMIYWSPLAVLAFPERNMVSNKWSFFILLVWLFMTFILMQSYTANLSAILTVDQLKFAFSDNYYIGCQEGSFMKQFLTEQLHISALRLRTYSSPEEFHKAMSLGSKNEGIDAIFDEVPYMKVFLNKYDSQYKMVGPTYRTGGFGFAFPIGSPLVSRFSKAIIDVTQGPNMTSIEQENFGPGYSSQDPLSSSISQQTSSLTFYDFAGLFVIVGSVTILALLCSETAVVGRKLTDKAKHVIFNCYNSRTTQVNSMENANGDGDSRSQGSLDEEIHHAMQNNVSNPEENTDPHAIGEMEPREIGQSHETSCAQIRSES